MASRQELLQSIHPKMRLDKAFFMKVYGYEISFPGFADEAIKALNDAGCSRAREYYNKAVSEYEQKHDEEMKEVAAWYRKECEKQWQNSQMGGEEKRKWRIMQDLHQMSDRELLGLLRTLN